MSNRIRSYDELRAFVHQCLRRQNPQWVDANGDSPICDEYEARSASHGVAFVYRNGVEIGRASVTVPQGEHIGIQVFTALGKIDADGHREWLAVAAIGDGTKVSLPDLVRRSSDPGRVPPKGPRGYYRRNNFDFK